MVEVQYGLRLDGEEKKAFEELCRRNSISMAQAIKDFIHRANQAGELDVTETTIAPSSDALAEINDRLSALDNAINDRLHALENRWDIDTGDRLAKLEDSLQVLKKAVTALETIAPITPDQIAELSDRLEEQGKGLSSVKTQILRIDKSLGFYRQFDNDISEIYKNQTELSSRLNKLETPLGDRPALPKREIPQGLTHKEIAAMIGSSERTMQRVSKEKERWPEGYHWSEESKKWFPMEG